MPVDQGPDVTNPKDLVGQAKVNIALIPAPALFHIAMYAGHGRPRFDLMPGVGLAHMAHAMMDGAFKYDPYNWRSAKVRSMIYLSAGSRHWLDFADGEDLAEDSECHHLGHFMSCGGIILDALHTGNLIDDRPPGGAAPEMADTMEKFKSSASVSHRLNRAMEYWLRFQDGQDELPSGASPLGGALFHAGMVLEGLVRGTIQDDRTDEPSTVSEVFAELNHAIKHHAERLAEEKAADLADTPPEVLAAMSGPPPGERGV